VKNFIVGFISAIIYLILADTCLSQTLQVFDVDAQSFPAMKAKFYAFVASGKEITYLSPSDFHLTENGLQRTVTNVSCPAIKPPNLISSVLTIDVSGSMSGTGLNIAKVAAKAWVQSLPLGASDCAVSSFDNNNYINQDFTTDRTKLISAIDNLKTQGGTDYNFGLLNPLAGSLVISKTGKHKKVIVFLTDGQPNSEPQVAQIIAEANSQNCVIYSVVLKMSCPQCLKDISGQTGGQWFENVNTEEDAKKVYEQILITAQGEEPCSLEWQSDVSCQPQQTDIVITVSSLNLTAKTSYIPPVSSIARLEFSPPYIIFQDVPPGGKKCHLIKITAINADFNITKITCSNPAFTVNRKSFSLPKGQSTNISVCFAPLDSGYVFTKITFENNYCPAEVYISGGWPGKAPKKPTLKLTKPNGGEIFVAGTDTLITWEGISETDTVQLEYTTDNGNSWNQITNKATGLKYLWKNIPKPASNQCKVRVIQSTNNDSTNKPGTLEFTLGGHNGCINDVSYSPNGRYIVTASNDRTAIIWDAVNGVMIRKLSGHTNCVLKAKWSPDGTRIATASSDETAIIWDANTGKRLNILNGQNSYVTNLIWSPNGNFIATEGNLDYTVIVWDAIHGTKINSFEDNYSSDDFSWSRDSRRIAIGGKNYEGAIIWDVITGTKLLTFDGHNNMIWNLSWSPDGNRLATASIDSFAIIWDVKTGAIIHILKGSAGLYHISWSPDGSKVATSSRDSNAIIWDVITGAKICNLNGINSYLSEVKWSPDGSLVATVGNNKTADIWDINTGGKIHNLIGHESWINNINWSPDGKYVVTASWDSSSIIWDANTGAIIHTLRGHSNFVDDINWSPDGSSVATASRDKTVIIWNAYTGSNLKILKGHTERVYAISWSPDGKLVATASKDKTAIIWNSVTGEIIYTLIGHSGDVDDISWSPDGKKVATASYDNTAIIWDVQTGTILQTLTGHKEYVYNVCWSPDGKLVATACNDGSSIIWDVATGNNIHKLAGDFDSYYNRVSWSPNGKQLASIDYNARIWDVNKGLKLLTLNENNYGDVTFNDWSPDGSRLATAGNDKLGIIWDVSNGKVLKTLKGHTAFLDYISWSPEAIRIATSSGDKSGIIWDAMSGSIFYKLNGHTDDVNKIKWNPEGSRVATSSWDKTAKIWFVGNSPLQLDESDTVFSIVAPQAQAIDIDMKQCLVGSGKDSVVTGFISNIGTYKLRVDSIYFSGADSNAFKLVSGLPKYEIEAGSIKQAEFRFVPNRVGVHNATINIITQSDTLKQSIRGEGVQPGLEILTKILDFGKVDLGDEKIFEDTALIKNISGSPITINDVVQLGPDLTQFEIVGGGGSFTLQPGDIKKLSVKFKPVFGGRTSGQLGFEYNGVGSPAIVQLFGIGIGGLVYITSDSAYAGEIRILKLMLSNIKPEGIASIAPNFEATIRFQSSILSPINCSNCSIVNDSVYMNLKGLIGSSLELARIHVLAALGNVQITTVDIVGINLVDNAGNIVDYNFETASGLFKLLGICTEGGLRLIEFGQKIQLFDCKPNPANDKVQFDFTTIEDGHTELFISDMLGNKLMKVFDSEIHGKYSIEADLSLLYNGVYAYTLQTPTKRLSKLFVIDN
jgi:WD40 repeat protein